MLSISSPCGYLKYMSAPESGRTNAVSLRHGEVAPSVERGASAGRGAVSRSSAAAERIGKGLYNVTLKQLPVKVIIFADEKESDLARPRGVEVETADGSRMFEGAGRDDAPRIVAELVAAGEQVYEVRALRSTLEDVYVEAVS